MPFVQQLAIYFGLLALNAWGAIPPLPPINARTLRAMLPITSSFLLYLILGMLALKGVSIPMYASLRRFTVLFVMAFEYIVSRQLNSSAVLCTIGVQVIGCVMAAVNDVEYDLYGYIAIGLYNAATAIYLVIIKSTKGKHDFLNSYSMMYLNSVMLLPVLLVMSLVTGELAAMKSFEYLYEFNFLFSFSMSAVLAFVLNYAIFWNTTANSALTQVFYHKKINNFFDVFGIFCCCCC